MDRPIERRAWYRNKKYLVASAALIGIAALGYYQVQARQGAHRFHIDQLMISTVTREQVSEVIPVRGSVQPLITVFLDAVDGGQIAEIYVEEGSFVEEGQPIVLLQNTDLRLNVARNDTSITEQINNLSNIANSLEMTRISTQRELLDIEFRIVTLERRVQQIQRLALESLASQEELLSATGELRYYQQVRVNVQERQALEDRIRHERLSQIGVQMEKLEENLDVAQQSYSSLLVRAPLTGQLTSLSAIIGENKARGQRIGQIDSTDQNKIVAQVDEFYLGRVSTGQLATFSVSGRSFEARVSRVYAEVSNNSFAVDFEIEGATPESLRRGQSIQLTLVSDEGDAAGLAIQAGEYVRQSGGNWVFVVSEDGQRALRREIVTGRRNNRAIEVLEGLDEGERIVTSSYASLLDARALEIRR